MAIFKKYNILYKNTLEQKLAKGKEDIFEQLGIRNDIQEREKVRFLTQDMFNEIWAYGRAKYTEGHNDTKYQEDY